MTAAGIALGFDLLVEVKKRGDGHLDAAGLGVDDGDVSAVYPTAQPGVRQAKHVGGEPPTDGRAELVLKQDACGRQVRVVGMSTPSATQPEKG